MADDIWKMKSGEIKVEVSDEPYKYAKPAEEGGDKHKRENDILEQAAYASLHVNKERYAGTYMRGFAAGAMWAEEHPNWISTAERLPNREERVLVAMVTGCVFDALLVQNYDVWRSDCDSYRMEEITHWMKLPNAPKFEEGGDK